MLRYVREYCKRNPETLKAWADNFRSAAYLAILVLLYMAATMPLPDPLVPLARFLGMGMDHFAGE